MATYMLRRDPCGLVAARIGRGELEAPHDDHMLRRDPFRDLSSLSSEMQRLLDPYRQRSGEGEDRDLQANWTPAVDVYEDKDGIVLKLEVPEVSQKDIDLSVEGNTLTVRGERKLENAENRDGYHRVERVYGAFARTFTLPSTVDTEHIRAESKDGVLRVLLPKRPESKPRSIKVAVESGLKQ